MRVDIVAGPAGAGSKTIDASENWRMRRPAVAVVLVDVADVVVAGIALSESLPSSKPTWTDWTRNRETSYLDFSA